MSEIHAWSCGEWLPLGTLGLHSSSYFRGIISCNYFILAYITYSGRFFLEICRIRISCLMTSPTTYVIITSENSGGFFRKDLMYIASKYSRGFQIVIQAFQRVQVNFTWWLYVANVSELLLQQHILHAFIYSVEIAFRMHYIKICTK